MRTREQQLFDKVKQNKKFIDYVFDIARRTLTLQQLSHNTMLGIEYINRVSRYIYQEEPFNPAHPEPDFFYNSEQLSISFSNRDDREYFFEVNIIEDEDRDFVIKTNMFVGNGVHPDDLYLECTYPDYDNWVDEEQDVPVQSITFNALEMRDIDIVVTPDDKDLFDYIRQAHRVFYPEQEEMTDESVKKVLETAVSVYQNLTIKYPLFDEAFVDSVETFLENNDGDESGLESYRQDMVMEMGNFIIKHLPLFKDEDDKLLITQNGDYCDSVIGYIVLYARLIKEIDERIKNKKLGFFK